MTPAMNNQQLSAALVAILRYTLMREDHSDEDKIQQKIYEREELDRRHATMVKFVHSPGFDKNVARFDGRLDPDQCLICGKLTPNPKFGITWLTCMEMVPPDEIDWFADHDGGFMGQYPVGPDCARADYLKPFLCHYDTIKPVYETVIVQGTPQYKKIKYNKEI